MSDDGMGAMVSARNVPVIDTFFFSNSFLVPSTVSFMIEWKATGPPEEHGSGSDVDPTDRAAFLGNFAPAVATGQFSGAELGFSFMSKPGASTDPKGYAELGTERNGVFLP